MPNEQDVFNVTKTLGRSPRGDFLVAVRTFDGLPVVIRNPVVLDDGTLMPTIWWLVGQAECLATSRLESTGGVKQAEMAVDPVLLQKAHHVYAAKREAMFPFDYKGPRPRGGVGGTRKGVKCLHAHLAWFLAGGDDPVGRWTFDKLGLDGTSYQR
ncbi:MAG: DUF501 domain-containing protein [Actinobacteria bacterium]|jgi:hypothetical protein|nr:DUF501 domain-containing protein [Actinomycetota bacterium]MCL6105277.1 DUF501 domain-containing protein [Actinomycetota bacterium]